MTAMSAPHRDRKRAVLEAERVSLCYGNGPNSVRALNDVSLEVLRGEMTFLVGPSGSGKTTLLQVLGGLRQATKGRISVLGQDLDALDTEALAALRLRHFGFVFQHYHLFPTLTARENVRVALEIKGIKGRAGLEESDRLLEGVGLWEFRHSFPSELSGGQRQRVAIARALTGNPDVILADEPSSALDAASGASIVQLFSRIAHGMNRAVVIVTHDHRLLAHADRIMTIEDGAVVTDTIGKRRPEGGGERRATAFEEMVP